MEVTVLTVFIAFYFIARKRRDVKCVKNEIT